MTSFLPYILCALHRQSFSWDINQTSQAVLGLNHITALSIYTARCVPHVGTCISNLVVQARKGSSLLPPGWTVLDPINASHKPHAANTVHSISSSSISSHIRKNEVTWIVLLCIVKPQRGWDNWSTDQSPRLADDPWWESYVGLCIMFDIGIPKSSACCRWP